MGKYAETPGIPHNEPEVPKLSDETENIEPEALDPKRFRTSAGAAVRHRHNDIPAMIGPQFPRIPSYVFPKTRHPDVDDGSSRGSADSRSLTRSTTGAPTRPPT
jgi:hypothetical protein